MAADPIVLPALKQRLSPNVSSRNHTKIDLLVWHETAGAYNGSVNWLCNPDAQASAHLVVREDGQEATQLVPLAEKAWHACAYNPRAVGVEHANITSKGYATEEQLRVSARIFGWLCLHLNVPPRFARHGVGPGICRHLDLGQLGCGHTACGMGDADFFRWLEMVQDEIERGEFKPDFLK